MMISQVVVNSLFHSNQNMRRNFLWALDHLAVAAVPGLLLLSSYCCFSVALTMKVQAARQTQKNSTRSIQRQKPRQPFLAAFVNLSITALSWKENSSYVLSSGANHVDDTYSTNPPGSYCPESMLHLNCHKK